MLKKSASIVLASFRPSTYPKGTPRAFTRCGLAAERRVLARLGWAGEKSGHFEHPAEVFYCCAARLSSSQMHFLTIEVLACPQSFSAAC
jgi:hypothetical protein